MDNKITLTGNEFFGQAGVYVLSRPDLLGNLECLYVGHTQCIYKRFADHSIMNRSFIEDTDIIEIYLCESKADACALEHQLSEERKPKYRGKQGPRGKGTKITREIVEQKTFRDREEDKIDRAKNRYFNKLLPKVESNEPNFRVIDKHLRNVIRDK